MDVHYFSRHRVDMFTRSLPFSLFIMLYMAGLVHGGVVVAAAAMTVWINEAEGPVPVDRLKKCD
jgi:hypothetical protein